MRLILLSSVLLAGCSSLLPDPPATPPRGVVVGLAPVYFEDAPGTDAIELLPPRDGCTDFRQTFDTIRQISICIERLEGLHFATPTNRGDLLATAFVPVPGIRALLIDSVGGSLLTAVTAFGEVDLLIPPTLDTLAVLSERPEDSPRAAAQQFPPAELLWTLDRLEDLPDSPEGENLSLPFTCPDMTRGPVADWQVTEVASPQCLTQW